jgi:hypothetical protein
LKNIFETGELNTEVVISKMETTTQHGVIAVGYCVNSERAIIFRNWAREILKEYILKGYYSAVC